MGGFYRFGRETCSEHPLRASFNVPQPQSGFDVQHHAARVRKRATPDANPAYKVSDCRASQLKNGEGELNNQSSLISLIHQKFRIFKW
jgi:hypothetical protein